MLIFYVYKITAFRLLALIWIEFDIFLIQIGLLP